MAERLRVNPEPDYSLFFRDPEVGDGILQPPANCRVVHNIRIALQLLNYPGGKGETYDETLAETIKHFQTDNSHKHCDGLFGPGTRALLTSAILTTTGKTAFSLMIPPEDVRRKIIFLSYSWDDSSVVDKFDQWLQDHNVQVIRDSRSFLPGMQISDAIADAVTRCDKVIAVYSKSSSSRDWPTFERHVALQKEMSESKPVLIYLVLDATPLPTRDQNRIYVPASGRTLASIGQDILRGIGDTSAKYSRINYDDNEVF